MPKPHITPNILTRLATQAGYTIDAWAHAHSPTLPFNLPFNDGHWHQCIYNQTTGKVEMLSWRHPGPSAHPVPQPVQALQEQLDHYHQAHSA